MILAGLDSRTVRLFANGQQQKAAVLMPPPNIGITHDLRNLQVVVYADTWVLATMIIKAGSR